MFSDAASSEAFGLADERCKHLLEDVLDALDCAHETCEAQPSEDLFAEAEWHKKICLITSGTISYQQNQKTLYHYEQGDLIGLEPAGKAQGQYRLEFAVELKCYDGELFWQQISASPKVSKLWTQYLLAAHCRHTLMLETLITPSENTNLGFKNFAAGDTIIEEGTEAEAVYSIIEGHAEVFVKGVKVGEVLEDEIFGALALLTNSHRTASVIADRNCMVMVVPHDQFETMIQTHPRICMSLMENMARQIVSLNQQVTTNA